MGDGYVEPLTAIPQDQNALRTYSAPDPWLVGNGGMGYRDYDEESSGRIIGIHSPIPY